jgi:hypothetical protein
MGVLVAEAFTNMISVAWSLLPSFRGIMAKYELRLQ